MSKDIQLDRIKEYDESHCWQYNIRLLNYEQDLIDSNLTSEEAQSLRVSDFVFKNVTEKKDKDDIKNFIIKHEWLGKISLYPTHWFSCYYKDILSGAIIFNVPNAFSKMLGKDTRKLERLISRGACISWSPKNLASSFLMWCINWMVQNTPYKLFTAYSDPTANELGTIYQACNFYYLGQSSGTKKQYINPYSGKLVSDRFFRTRSAYKKYAKELNIVWEKDWNTNSRVCWENIPDDIELKLRKHSKLIQSTSKQVEMKTKHKYAYVKGQNKKETKELRKLFMSLNKIYKYPTKRGE